jgi:hypothetical protein
MTLTANVDYAEWHSLAALPKGALKEMQLFNNP